MTIEFYTLDLSPFCRPVWMTLEALGLKYTTKIVNPLQGETRTAEYAAINPMQKIPAIKEGSFTLGESKAIACYICNAYASQQGNSSLYPTDPAKRARVDMVLCVGDGISDNVIGYLNLFGVLTRGEKTKQEEIGKVHESLSIVEKLLSKSQYLAADHLTLADIFMYAKLGMLAVAKFDEYSKYPKLVAWMAKMSQLPYHKLTCEEPIAKFTEFYQSKLQGSA